jgi:Mediator complex subunit 27
MLRTQVLPSLGSDKPSKLYPRIQKIALEGLKDVEAFKQSWLSDESHALWKRTLNEPCPQGSDVWRVDYIAALRESKAHEERLKIDAAIPATDSCDAKDVIHNFRGRHASLKLECEDSTELIPFKISVAGMTFRIVSNDRGTAKYEVQYKEGSKTTELQNGILRHLRRRPVQGNLEFLLVRTERPRNFKPTYSPPSQNMIASYEDVKKRPCARCLHLFDKKLTFPVVRNQKSNACREKEAEWEALHVDCP